MKISEKLQVKGVKALSDVELLTLLLEDIPNAEECAQALLNGYGNSLANLLGDDVARLRMREGIGLKRAERIAAAAELGYRTAHQSLLEFNTISNSSDVITHFRTKLNALPHEECWVLYLTSANSIIESQRHSVGGIGATIVDHRLIIKRALELFATQIIMVHNHPSGSAQPSREDVELTEKVKVAAQLFDIKLLDHIIISRTEEYSFLNSRLL